MEKKRKLRARIISIITTACMIMVFAPTQEISAASITDVTYVESIELGNKAGDSVTITKIAPTVLDVQCTHSLDYTQMDVRLYTHGTNTLVKASGLTKPQYISYGLGAGESWQTYYWFDTVPTGTYKLVVYKRDANKDYKPYVDRITVKVTSSGINLVDYSAIRKQNSNVRALVTASTNKDTALYDFRYMLFKKDGSTTNRAINKSTESAYYKKIADTLVSTEDSDYDKLRKFYAYTAEKLYYDDYYKAKKKKAYDDPYYNLKHLNDTSSGSNWSKGRVAVQCDGYAGMFIALARSQGIPARMVGGNLMSSTTETWEKSSNVKSNTHCWVQPYVDDRWIEIDPCRASLNKRKSDGSWEKASQISYMFFDMTDVQMAQTHCSVEFMGETKNSQSVKVKATKYTKTYGNKAFSLGASAKTTLSYKTSNSKVATVSSKGTVTIKGPGYAKITVTAATTSKYKSASKTVAIYVKPKAVAKVKLKAAKKKMTVSWSKVTGASGYQVAYTTDKKFKKSIKKTTTTSVKKTISKLKSKKTYYVKVRAYKKVGSTKLYGSYSSLKKIKVK